MINARSPCLPRPSWRCYTALGITASAGRAVELPILNCSPRLYFGVTVVDSEGIGVQRQPTARQHTVLAALAGQRRVDYWQQVLEHLDRERVQQLAQCWAGVHQRHTERLLEEHFAAKALHCAEIALAMHGQAIDDRLVLVKTRWAKQI